MENQNAPCLVQIVRHLLQRWLLRARESVLLAEGSTQRTPELAIAVYNLTVMTRVETLRLAGSDLARYLLGEAAANRLDAAFAPLPKAIQAVAMGDQPWSSMMDLLLSVEQEVSAILQATEGAADTADTHEKGACE